MGYKWKKVQKGWFFYEHECEDVIEYQKTFSNEMKSLLPYFVEFYKDGTMVPKEYPDDYAVEGPDQRPIIRLYMMRIHFPPTINVKKYELLMVKAFCGLKKREKKP